MRFVAESTRTTIRIATVLAAAAALLLALAAPFTATAHAAPNNFAFAGTIYLSDGHDPIDLGDPNDPTTWTISDNHPQNVTIDGYEWHGDGEGNDGPSFHLSCSATPLIGTGVTILGEPDVFATIVAFVIHRDNYSEELTGPLTYRCSEGNPPVDPDPVSTTLTLIKVVQGGEAIFSDFIPVVTAGEATLDFSFGSQDVNEATDVEPGTYTLGEQDAEGYDLAGIVCDNDTATADDATELDVTLAEGDEVTCTFTNVASTTDDEIIEDDDDETLVLDDVFTDDDETTGGAVDSDTDVKAGTDVLDETAELAATGLETVHLALLAALLAALGVLFLLGTETNKVSAYRA